MKTETLDAARSIETNNVSLEGFIVRETLAKDVLVSPARPRVARTFTAADLWNIQRTAKTCSARR
jgi:hypothetical protein